MVGVMVVAVLAQVIRDVDMVVTSLYLVGQLKDKLEVKVCLVYLHTCTLQSASLSSSQAPGQWTVDKVLMSVLSCPR